jgi:hypothetical protein
MHFPGQGEALLGPSGGSYFGLEWSGQSHELSPVLSPLEE